MILPPGNNLIWLYRLKWNVAADICINPARAHQGAQEEKQNSSFAHQCHHSLSSTVQVVERSSRQEVIKSLKLQILNLGFQHLLAQRHVPVVEVLVQSKACVHTAAEQCFRRTKDVISRHLFTSTYTRTHTTTLYTFTFPLSFHL